jgi:2-amino-4-hydroxy-6-hydroxymethyldihydropteridine diphosphokinase
MSQLLLGLGSNEGNRMDFLASAIKQIGLRVGKVIRLSSVYETQPWGFNHESQFLNQVAEVETTLSPGETIKTLLIIEKELGRCRQTNGYAARTIDIDILFFDQQIIHSDNLIVPHPHIAQRRFVLEPLSEIVPHFVHPLLQKSIEVLLKECLDNGKVLRA